MTQDVKLIQAKKDSGLLCAFLLCIVAAIPALSLGNGLTQGFTLFETVRAGLFFLGAASLGYAIGYFVPFFYRGFIAK